MTDTFHVGIEFESVLAAISKQIYDTPLAFIRENVQNAVDAIRMQAAREAGYLDDDLAVNVSASSTEVEIRDNGIGMTLDELKGLFWTIGASGKRTEEAKAAGCVGMFGIGGFANFGVCSALSVVSNSGGTDLGYETVLSRTDIENARGAIPEVTLDRSDAANPRGTVVKGSLSAIADVDQLETYLQDFVKYADERVYFNGKLLSQQQHILPSQRDDTLTALGTGGQEWSHGQVTIQGRLYEEPGHVLCAELTGIQIEGSSGRLTGVLRFENGPIDVLKRGFKLCTTTVSTQIGVSGSLDCDELSPTAGRDSLDPKSSSLISSIMIAMERAAILEVLASSQRIAQHTRIFPYVRRNRLVREIGNTVVELADGSESTLTDIQRRSKGGIKVFFSTSKNPQLAHILQARGHIVVQLPYDGHKQRAVREFLIQFCAGESFEGRVECLETYSDLSRFEKYFLSELEETILGAFEVVTASLVAGRLSEDIPVTAIGTKSRDLTIYVDVRHSEISKLESLGINNLFRSMVAAFCSEYLSPMLKAHSPRFFGSGAVNVDFLSKRRSELWVLLTDDIETVTRGTQRQIVRTADVQVIRAGSGSIGQPLQPEDVARKPKLVRIVGADEFSYLLGYYLRIPESAVAAYGDVIQQCEDRAALWAGNKITLFASDSISTAFQFDIRLDRLITPLDAASGDGSGVIQMDPPVQALYDGLYFPIPSRLDDYLVPTHDEAIRIEVRCEWTDYSSARTWSSVAEKSA